MGSFWDVWTNKNDFITGYSFTLLVEGVTNVPLRSVKAFKR